MVGSLEILTGKSNLDPQITAFFAESDRSRIRRAPGRRGFTSFAYSVPSAQMRSRLNLCGVPEAAARRAFDAGIRQRIEEATDPSNMEQEDSYTKPVDEEVRVLRTWTYDKWLFNARNIIQKGYKPFFNEPKGHQRLTQSERLILQAHNGNALHLGFPWTDPAILLRAFCDAAPDAEVVLDFEELVLGGHLSAKTKHTQIAKEFLAASHLQFAPVIILTEGKTDARYLEWAMTALHPRLAHMFSFLDFSAANNEGGTGALAASVKAFAASHVQARIVALFDNDAAGHVAIKTLPKLPKNIAVSALPDYSFLKRYPTLGPKNEKMNVNGRAASLELYLGRDVLKLGRTLMPVRWTGFERRVKRYQGELIDKHEVHRKAELKLREAASTGRLGGGDWEGLRLVCAHMLRLAEKARFGVLRASNFVTDY